MGTNSSLGSFLKKYGSEAQCLEAIKDLKYPKGIFCKKCKQISKFYQVKNRPLYECSCGYQVSILKGTIFEGTKISLFYWCYAIFIMSNTRSGISAKTLQRELGVAYNTAWRMFRQIRSIMGAEPNKRLLGVVEADETFVGGKGYNRGKKWWGNWEETPKEVVMGMVERGGSVITKHIPNNGKWTLLKQIQENIDPSTHIITDNWHGYWNLPKFGYKHDSVNHAKHYVRGDIYTQNIESFWSHPKRGITGVYRHVSKKYLQSYFDEYAFRFNHRKEPGRMFDILLSRVSSQSQ